ncbi:beta strand repeat-containing protein, partial [Shewanella frigidimarina]|uniref:beta strand repeat-containing protein n=2 Tax=Shewanella TaxID=22 RepID=UPI003D79633A
TVTLATGTQVGDTLIVTDGNGNTLFNGPVTQDMLDNGFDVEVPVTAGATDVDVTAQVIDIAGNPSATATDTQPVDATMAPAPTVEFSGMGTDGVFNSDEIGTDGTVTATVTLATGTQVGDTLIVTDGNGNTLFNGPVTQDMLDNGFDVEVPVTAGATDVDVTAQVIDIAGNPSATATDTQPVDATMAPAPTVEFSGMGTDGVFNSDEIGTDGTVTATVTLAVGTEVGDTLIVTDGNGNTLFNGPVTQDMLDNGFDVEVPVTAGATDVDVTAQVIDIAGNPSATATDNQPVDATMAPAPTVEFSGMGTDGVFNSDEIGTDGTVTATVTLATGTQVGDTLIVTDGNGNVLASVTVTQDMLDNGYPVEVPVTAGATDVNVTAQVIDIAGNPSAVATDVQGVDRTAPSALSIIIVDDGVPGDGWLNYNEIAANGNGIQIKAEVDNADLVAGGFVSISITVNGYDVSFDLKLENGQLVNLDGSTTGIAFNYDNGEITWTADVPSPGEQITVEITQTDAAGNESTAVTDTASINNVDANDDLPGTSFSVTAGATNAWTIPQSNGESLMKISGRTADGSMGVVNIESGSNKLGVAGSPRTSGQIAGQIEYDSATGTSESIVIDFNGLVNQATFSVSNMFSNENNGEQGVWKAYYNGQLVASDTFKTTSGDAGTFSIDTGNIVFDQLVFEATKTISEANGGAALVDSSDYFLTNVTASGPAIMGTYLVSEDGVLTISSTSQGLLNNDSDAQANTFALTGVNGAIVTDGQVVILPSGALLTIHSDGTYSYDTNDSFEALTAGQLATDTFTYTVTDQYGATDTATVTINIVGEADASSTYVSYNGNPGNDVIKGTPNNDIIVSDQQGLQIVAGENYNIAFILDTSGSMSNLIASAKLQLESVFNSLADSATGSHSGVVNVLLTNFATGSNISISVNMDDPNAVQSLVSKLNSLSANGWTNYEAGFDAAINWFSSSTVQQNVGHNLSFFITDGTVNRSTIETDITKILIGYDVNASQYVSLSSLMGSNYSKGTILKFDGKLVVDANGNVYSIYTGKTLGKMTFTSNGKFASYSDTDSTSTTNTQNEALHAFNLLAAVSEVEAISLKAADGSTPVGEANLKLYDTDGNVRASIDVSNLSSVITGSETLQSQGDDNTVGNQGDDIIFGDLVRFSGSSEQGYVALQTYVADKTGQNVGDVDVRAVHDYIRDHVNEFNINNQNDGNDILDGGIGDDILFGQGGNDVIYGGEGNDVLIGGLGNDTLIGGLGNDTFVWSKGDTGTDTIKDFEVNNDSLHISDLLQNEQNGDLDNYLDFSFNNGSTTISIDADHNGSIDQVIVLDGVDLSQEYGSTTDGVIINGLLNDGALIVDTATVNPAPSPGTSHADLFDQHNGNIIP